MVSKRKTAAELMADLAKDPSYIARRHAADEARRKKSEELMQAEAPLVKALAEVGLKVGTVWDLVNMPTARYPEAVPLLLAHFQEPYPDEIRGGIARALTVIEARPHWNTLARFYENEQYKYAKEGLAVALSGIATD